MSRMKKATFTPEYRMDRLERYARPLGLMPRRESRNAFEVEAGGRLYRFKVAGRTTVQVLAYRPQIMSDGTRGDYTLDATLTVSDERAESTLVKIAARLSDGDSDGIIIDDDHDPEEPDDEGVC